MVERERRAAAWAWTPDLVSRVDADAPRAIPPITAADAVPAIAHLDLWDMWPLQHPDGRTVRIDGREGWFLLSSDRLPDPGQRHDVARIRFATFDGAAWTDCGPAMPDGFNPGSREWAGSAVLFDDGLVRLFFTAAGRPDAPGSFEQRLFQADATLSAAGADWRLGDWRALVESVASDGDHYVRATEAAGVPGAIKAFRDPAFFRDPADGADYLLFTASAGWDDHPYNGVVGIAAADGDGWRLLPPLATAVGVNNELERAHVVVRDGRYYLFWSTQRRTFAQGGPSGPNGLYALVGDSLCGPWRPANGTGLVLANPADEPVQCYSWWVTAEGEVAGFIDHWGMAGRTFEQHPELLRQQFGGTPAPRVTLHFDGDRVTPTAD